MERKEKKEGAYIYIYTYEYEQSGCLTNARWKNKKR